MKVSTFVIVIVNVIACVPSCTDVGFAVFTTASLVGTSVIVTSAPPLFDGFRAVVIGARRR